MCLGADKASDIITYKSQNRASLYVVLSFGSIVILKVASSYLSLNSFIFFVLILFDYI